MKWGRKKPSSSSSNRTSSISHVFPISWLSRFKHMGEKSEAVPPKVKPEKQQNLPSRSSAHSHHTSRRNGTFYGGEDDAFWRLSFGKENVYERKTRAVSKSVSHESDEELEFLRSSCQSCRSIAREMGDREDTHLFSNMVSNIRKMRQLPSKSAQEDDLLKWKPELAIRTTKRDHPKLKASRSSRYPCYVSSETRNSNLGTIEDDHAFAAVNIEETDGVLAEWES